MILRNSLFGLGAQFALRIVGFLFNVLIIRTLGGEAYGQYNIVIAWAALFSVIGDLGINQYLAREIAREPKKATELFWDTVALRFVLAVIASVITITGAATIGVSQNDYTREIILGVAIYTSSYFLQAVMAPLSSILVGHERLDITSALGVITQVLFMVAAGIFLLMGLNFVWVVVASVVTLPIVTYLHYRAVRRNNLGPPRFKINPGMWFAVIKAGFPFGLVQLALSFSFRVDTIILSAHTPDEQIGWYNAAYTLTLTLLSVTRAFNDAILPTLAREHSLNPESVRPWYFRSVKMMLFLGIPIAVGGMLTAGKLVEIIYQPEMAPAAICLAILVWDIPVVMYHSFCGNLTTSIKREGSAARIYGSLGIINTIINLVFIPRFGIIGASFATVVTDMVGAVQFYFLFRHHFGAGLGFKRLARIALGGILMGLLIYLLRDWNFFLIAAIAALFYGLFVWFIGAFSPEERSQMLGFVTRRLRSRAA